MAKVMTARWAGTCTAPECGGPIQAGSRINYGGYGAVTHETCPAMDAPGASAHNGYRSPRAYRRASKYGHGRCEDAPCCGCCD